MMSPSAQVKTVASIPSPQQEVASYYSQEVNSSTEDVESIEAIGSYEIIFKEGIRKSLKGLNTINQIPV
jgi:hypothetical protein